MIKHLIFLLLLCLLCVGSASLLQNDPGYILLIFHDWQIQTSLVMFSLCLILSLALIYACWRLILSGFLLPAKVQQYYQAWQHQRVAKEAIQGIEAYIQENWKTAYNLLEKHANHPWYLHLLAAQSAEKLADDGKRNHALELAYQDESASMTTLVIAQAKMHIHAKRFEQAQACLAQVAPKLRPKLRIWHQLQTSVDLHFGQVEAVLHRLTTYASLLKQETWYLSSYQAALLGSLDQNMAFNEALRRFKALPSALQLSPKLLQKFSPWLQQEKFFQKLIQQLLDHSELTPEVLQLLAELNPNEKWQLDLEQKLLSEPNKAGIHTCLGKWYAKQQLWGKALRHLKQSQSRAAYLELAKVYLALEQTANAMQAMQNALKIETEVLSFQALASYSKSEIVKL